MVVILGEAGIGKTRLVDEFVGRLADDTVLVVRANCSPGAARELPLAAVRELVNGLSKLLGPRLDRVAAARGARARASIVVSIVAASSTARAA